MPTSRGRVLTAGVLTGLFYLSKYRFQTIAQFARIANFSLYHTAEVLRDFERWGMVGYFGAVFLPGHGKTPKVYYLKRKGFDLLCAENSLSFEMTEPFAEVHKEVTWTPQMYHRIKTIDMLISAEIAIRARPHLTMIKAFLGYKMIKKGLRVTRETTDFFAKEETSENKIIPDAAFIIENIQTKKRALFFIEMDMATEQIVSRFPGDNRSTLHQKFAHYDKYLTSLRYSQTYAAYGEFRFFTLLFVTLNDTRIDN